ncbi:MAG: hypothetical protein JNM12_02845 [Alphaproteobacteria bacterium]|nr:hypothetical protein [Alphaproteobacteria bacterium]
MKKWKIFAVVSCLCFVVAACTGAGGFSDETIRYKMTVTVETPEGIKTGSAVREAVRHTEPSILPEQGGATYNISKGEAVVIDLGQRGILFALLGGEWEAKIAFHALAHVSKAEMFELDPLMKKWGSPRFVFFKNAKNPETVIAADFRNLEKDFGLGVKLASFEMERTVEPVRVGIVHQNLPWLDKVHGYISGKNISGPSLFENLDTAEFKRN